MRSNLNSNSNFGLQDGQPRVSPNGNINPQLVVSTKSTSFKCNECGEGREEPRLQSVDVAVKDVLNEIQGSKGNRVVDANSEEVDSTSPKFECKGGNGIIHDKRNSSVTSKAVKANSGECSDEVIASRNIEEDGHRDHKGEMMGPCASLGSSSRTMTRTAQLSGNGYSEELAKLYHKRSHSMDEEVSKCYSSAGVTIWTYPQDLTSY